MNVLGKTSLEEFLLFGRELTDGVDLLDTVGLLTKESAQRQKN
jgi:hypothetical protein